MNRFAFVTGVDHRERLAAYLPANYAVLGEGSRGGRSFLVIGGQDSAGWTLDGFVLPRLASGLIFGEEVDEAAARAVVASSSRPDAYIGLPADSTARNLEHVTSLPPEVCCEECGEPIVEDASPGVWVHHPQLEAEAYDLNEDHAARPPEDYDVDDWMEEMASTPEPSGIQDENAEIEAAKRERVAKAARPRPDFDMRLDYPERFSDGPY